MLVLCTLVCFLHFDSKLIIQIQCLFFYFLPLGASFYFSTPDNTPRLRLHSCLAASSAPSLTPLPPSLRRRYRGPPPRSTLIYWRLMPPCRLCLPLWPTLIDWSLTPHRLHCPTEDPTSPYSGDTAMPPPSRPPPPSATLPRGAPSNNDGHR